MDWLKASIEDLHQGLQNQFTTPSELLRLSLEKAKYLQPKLNVFVSILEEMKAKARELDGQPVQGPLFGIPYALKDNFSTQGILTTGSSNTMKDYVPLFNATVVQKLNAVNAVMMGKTVLDELAMGGTGMNGHTGPTKNPYDPLRMAGGSSGGSVAAVAAGIVPFAIGSDTGDSVRKPAAYCGVVGFKPTWGLISRYGVFPFAPSLDHVGFFTRTVKDSAYVLEAIAGYDFRDMTSYKGSAILYSQKLDSNVKGKKVALIKPIVDSLNNQEVRQNINRVVKQLQGLGVTVDVVDFNLDLLKAVLPVYMVISSSEATSNNANLDGIVFGPRYSGATFDEVTFQNRTQGFSELVKRRFVLGSYCLSREHKHELFERAQRVRRLIVNETNRILSGYDAILTPAAGSVAPLLTSSNNEKLSDHYLISENHLAIGNFAGLPSITIPSGHIQGLPIAVNLMSKAFSEVDLLSLAQALESTLGMKNRIGGN